MEFFTNLYQFNDWGLLFLRVAVGIIFLIHGWPKIKGAKAMTSAMGKPEMAPFFTFLGIAETLGALAMFGGFLIQPAAIGLSIVMIGAIGMKKIVMKASFFNMENKPSWEFDFIILAATVSLIFFGAGKIGLDNIIFGI